MNVDLDHYYVIPILAIICGLVICFYGKRIFKPILFLAGVVSAGGIVYLLLNRYYPTFHEIDLVSIAAAVVGGFLAILVFKVGLFLVGTFVGYFLGVVLLTMAAKDLNLTALNDSTFHYFFLSLLGSTGGAVALKYEEWLVIMSTSLCGSFGAFVGVDLFLHQNLIQALKFAFLNNEPPASSYELYGMLGGICVLGFLGGYFQKKYLQETKQQEDKQQEGKQATENSPLNPKVIRIELK